MVTGIADRSRDIEVERAYAARDEALAELERVKAQRDEAIAALERIRDSHQYGHHSKGWDFAWQKMCDVIDASKGLPPYVDPMGRIDDGSEEEHAAYLRSDR